jgi:cobyrinic acid a,c-diamide synthase
MVNAACARLVIAGTGSGVGKTSLALGLARECARRRLRVQTFKVGPDFLDPTYLSLASGRTCYNLDGWMTSADYVRRLFARATEDADIAIIEGVMGMFDGASPSTLEGSTAEIAAWLDAPVLLVAGAHGASRSLAATVKGFAEFEPGIRIAGVLANQSGSIRHRDMLSEALSAAGLPPLLGAVPRGALPSLPSRHLGLVTANCDNLGRAILDQLADACRQHIDIDALLAVARRHSPATCTADRGSEPELAHCQSRPRARWGIARDDAFHFYYPDNLESLERAGVEWAPFSPMSDTSLPDRLDGLYLGGGYPEAHAAQLADNKPMIEAVTRFAASGRSIYAECGGLMYLGRSVTTLDNRRHAMAGVLPLDTAMLDTRKTLGYAEVTMTAESPLGPPGQICRGHEFHYSDILADEGTSNGWRRAYTVRRRRSEPTQEGFIKGVILAGYVHLHWASHPDVIGHFLSRNEAIRHGCE